jgi:hypothetical protein
MGHWGPAEFLVPRLSSSSRFAIAESGDALSILCDEGSLSLRKEDGRFNLAWSGSLAFPITDPTNGPYTLRVRGYVAKNESARGLVLVDVAGGTIAREYPYGRAFDEEFTIETSFVINKWMNRRVTVSFALLLERQSDDDEATLVIDTGDAAVIQPGTQS